MPRNDPQVAIRLPPEVKRFIKAEAKLNASSQNSEIVRCIRERMERKKSSDGVHEPGQLNTAAAETRQARQRPSDATREDRTL